MRAIDYAFRQGWASLRRGGGSTLFAVVAIALAMSVLGGLLLVTWNVERLLARWTTSAEFSVYLRDDATSEQRGVIEAFVDQSGAAAGREYVSKEQALVRFRTEFAELASTAAGIGDNPFPASIEVRMQSTAERDGRADALLKKVATLPGVADIRYDRAWLSKVGAGLDALRRAGGVLALMMALAAAVTVAAVVRLGLHARREEIEIMQLVGASMAFIRGPFVAEGLLQGGIGAVGAVLLLWGGFAVASASWGPQLASALEGVDPQFLPARFCALLVAGGMLVGGAGGFAASRHAV
ncbi:MAG TPA: permease-like cell division protein FtsX [Vicinamibacterales bacterium]|nr:permease-like cell division protein FtsX [Vicinamibacterales bacterium]